MASLMAVSFRPPRGTRLVMGAVVLSSSHRLPFIVCTSVRTGLRVFPSLSLHRRWFLRCFMPPCRFLRCKVRRSSLAVLLGMAALVVGTAVEFICWCAGTLRSRCIPFGFGRPAMPGIMAGLDHFGPDSVCRSSCFSSRSSSPLVWRCGAVHLVVDVPVVQLQRCGCAATVHRLVRGVGLRWGFARFTGIFRPPSSWTLRPRVAGTPGV